MLVKDHIPSLSVSCFVDAPSPVVYSLTELSVIQITQIEIIMAFSVVN